MLGISIFFWFLKKKNRITNSLIIRSFYIILYFFLKFLLKKFCQLKYLVYFCKCKATTKNMYLQNKQNLICKFTKKKIKKK